MPDKEITEWIEIFYDRPRRQTRLWGICCRRPMLDRSTRTGERLSLWRLCLPTNLNDSTDANLRSALKTLPEASPTGNPPLWAVNS